MRFGSILVLVLALCSTGCKRDRDDDGAKVGEDCNDFDPHVSPTGAEICDGLDNDCSGVVDDNVAGDPAASGAFAWLEDLDGDGYGNDDAVVVACVAPFGTVPRGGDCDDGDATFNPAAQEADCADPNDYNCDGSVEYADADGDGFAACEDCDDNASTTNADATEACNGVDDNCNGITDEEAANATDWYADADGDGHGGTAFIVTACEAPEGYVASSDDCDDLVAAMHPGASETCDGLDDDCSGSATNESDADADGFLACAECDDALATSHPGATEWCNTVDDDCDGTVDEADAADAAMFYRDVDGDTFGAGAATIACAAPSGFVATNGDCADANASVYPTADEVCNGVDDDCDGTIDIGASDASTWYVDSDADGFGNIRFTQVSCNQPLGWVASSTDCDDTLASRHPGATEVCDGEDNDCSGAAGSTEVDADGDHFLACDECDDTRAAVSPAAAEICDGLDNDCDATVDEDSAVDATTWYADVDGDAFGLLDQTIVRCEQPSGYVPRPGDCDDANASTNPIGVEYCNGIDDDCDGITDVDALDATLYYPDTDGDGFGDPTAATASCSAPAGFVTQGGDCEDADSAVWPGSHDLEVPGDGIDSNCDGSDDCTDLDCDGWPDIVVGSALTSTSDAQAAFGRGNVPFSNVQAIDANASFDQGAADLDNDGYLDLVVANVCNPADAACDDRDTASYVYYGSASGYSSADRVSLATRGAVAVCIGDFDRDGYGDIFFANNGEGTTKVLASYVYRGSASGFSSLNRTNLGTLGAFRCKAGDMDGDGYDDLVVANNGDGVTNLVDSYVFLGGSSGLGVSRRVDLPTNGAARILARDLNHDGYIDIAFANWADSVATDIDQYVYWGTATGWDTANRDDLTISSAVDLAAADFDGDGFDELVISDLNGASTIFRGSSTGYVNNAGGYQQLSTPYAEGIAIGDFNGDGYLDVAFTSLLDTFGTNYDTTSPVYWGSRTGFNTVTNLTTHGAVDAQARDLDLDGMPELIFVNEVSGSVGFENYFTDSVVYWSTPNGFSDVNASLIPSEASINALVVGAP